MRTVLRVVRRLASLPGVRLLTHVTPLLRLSFALRGSLVREPLRFARNELRFRSVTASYRLRGSDVVVTLRHQTPDVLVLDEIFSQREYELPVQVRRVLDGLGRPPRVADLGANIGLFGAWVLARYPDAVLVALEPDPENAAVLRRTIEANGRTSDWELLQACAAAEDGSVRFSPGSFTTSRAAEGPGAVTVSAVDVFPLLAGTDLVKIDIEGAEWSILGDRRFARLSASAIVLEYHAEHCPEADPRTAATKALRSAGYQVESGPDKPTFDAGLLWGWRGAVNAETAVSHE
jgi:FkbM family methyltransferase